MKNLITFVYVLVFLAVLAVPGVSLAQYGGGAAIWPGFFGGAQVAPQQPAPAQAPSAPAPKVLGAAVCAPYMTSYIFPNKQNDKSEVKKLQVFLNKELGTSLAVDGVYSNATIAVLNKFQLKYSDSVLRPWIAFGLPNANTSTGIVYKTTLHMINALSCPDTDIPAPQLP